MDVRIVNTCNSNCLYCLEQDLRKQDSFINVTEIYKTLNSHQNRKILSFYGGNPLLHPNLIEIITYAKTIGYENISLLTNTDTLNREYGNELKQAGLNSIPFYFHNFDEYRHDIIVNGGISLKTLMKNIKLIRSLGLGTKAIMHVNAKNIDTLLKNIKALHKYFFISSFEFINYTPVSRAYDEYDDILRYQEEQVSFVNIQNFIKSIGGELRIVAFGK